MMIDKDRPYIIHLREMEWDGEDNREQYSAWAATVAFVLEEDGVGVGVGVALCNPRDQFSKKMGRDIAIGRAKNKPTSSIMWTGLDDLNHEVMLFYADEALAYFLSDNFNDDDQILDVLTDLRVNRLFIDAMNGDLSEAEYNERYMDIVSSLS